MTADETLWAQELLDSLRWGPDMLVEPDDHPGQQWWLAHGGHGEMVDYLLACCQKDHPCPHHDGYPLAGHRLFWSEKREWWMCSCGVLSAEHEDD
jgi:hypothetical protein